MHHASVAVIGEALVDEFHDGAVAGGAPFNVARSLAALGTPTLFISRVAVDDAHSGRVLESARRYGLDCIDLQRDPVRATGRVSVIEDAGGGHRFEIHVDAAWDHIDAAAALDALHARPAQFAYFGTLAQRSAPSRAAVRALMKSFPGPRLLDLNLRDSPGMQQLAAESLMLADWLKINDEELTQLAIWFELPTDSEAATVTALMARFALQRVVLTLGPQGWRVYGDGPALEGAGEPQPRLVDSVGAGDAFTAMLLAGLALARDLHGTLSLANRYASFICGLRGPLPTDANAITPWRNALHSLPRTTP
ncbi:MAG TPA: PfkB family carbohydrate kinase [Burkholderiaceae bacterium]|jgi:fructokinase